MRNQFVADVNDYHKYKILNDLARGNDIHVCWMLNDDIPGQDSKFTNHKEVDSLAFFLDNLIKTGRRRISEIENSELIKVKRYYQQIEDISVDELSGILFFDPDNGIEVKSSKPDDRRYLYYHDINRFLPLVDLLVYQHFPRVKRLPYMEKLTREIFEKTGASTVMHFPQSMVDYVLIKKHR